MKFVLASLVIALAPSFVLAQGQGDAKPATTAKPATSAKHAPGRNKKPARSARKGVEEATPVDEDAGVALTDADLDVAKKVYVGDIPCELNAKVKIVPAKRPGFFLVSTKNFRFHMHPVESRTGAIRLEDAQRGAMWLQLGNKSMLMSQKLGQRLADECQSPEQVTYAEKLKANPAPSILDSTPGPQSTATAKQPGG